MFDIIKKFPPLLGENFENFKGQGTGSKFEIFLFLTYLKIWNMGVKELFTELKNVHRRPSNDATNMAPLRVFLAIYRGKWPKNGLKIN